MLNQVVLIGNLGKDPELRYTPAGVAVATCSIAVQRPTSGENKETDWFNLVGWRQTAEYMANYASKGRKVAVTGRLQARSWVGQDGKKNYTTEIVIDRIILLDRPKGENGGGGQGSGAPEPAGVAAGADSGMDSDYDPFAEE